MTTDAARELALTPLTDLSRWARGDGLLIVLIVIGAILLTRFANWLGARITQHIDEANRNDDLLIRSESSKHRHALAQVITWVTLVLIYCIAAVLIVKLFGVPLTGFVAPATVAGVALGFGAQRIVQDVLAGFFLISERQYGFGDVIRLNVLGVGTPVTGTVEEVTLRITRIRSLDGEVIITSNGQIVQVTNLSRDWARAVVDVPVPVAVGVDRATEILHKVGEQAFNDKRLKPLLLDKPSVIGVETIEVDQFALRMIARTQPGKQFEVGRALRARITNAFASAGINVTTSVDSAPATGAS
jgi:small conductance mechanosensitive channel